MTSSSTPELYSESISLARSVDCSGLGAGGSGSLPEVLSILSICGGGAVYGLGSYTRSESSGGGFNSGGSEASVTSDASGGSTGSEGGSTGSESAGG